MAETKKFVTEIESTLPRVYIQRKQWIFDERNRQLIDPQDTDIRVPLSKFQIDNLKWYIGELGELRQETQRLKDIISGVEKKMDVLKKLEKEQRQSAKSKLKEAF